MELPRFRYHRDPLASGMIQPSDAECRSCGRRRGYVYRGPVYSTEDLDSAICPWCIADGAAASKFELEFVDAAGVGGYGDWEPVPNHVVEEVSKRTPGFIAWQQERWWTHCGDAAEFLGVAGASQLKGEWSGAVDSIRAEAQMNDRDWAEYLETLTTDGSPSAYVFRCTRCGQLGGYSDCD